MDLRIVLKSTPFITSQKGLGGVELDNKTYYEMIDRTKGGYRRKVEMQSYLQFLMFSLHAFLTMTQPQTLHGSLGHPHVKD